MSDGQPVQEPGSPTPTPTPTPSTPEPPPPPQQDPAPEPEAASSLLGSEVEPDFDPEKITFPEGMVKDDQFFGDFTNIAKEHGLSGKAAQLLVDLAARHTKAANEALLAQWDKQQSDWQTEIKADKEVGGDKLDGVLQTFSKVANDPELTDPKFREALTYTGAGNNPAIIRTLARWSKALAEGGPVRGNPVQRDANGNAVTNRPMTIGEAFYPNGPHSGGPRLGDRS